MSSYQDSGTASANEEGASGSDSSSFNLSKGGLIAIIVIASLVALFGIASSILFYIAKKRSWEVRATIRRSAKRVATALTPRRSEFPKSVKDMGNSSRGRSRIPDVPPTQRNIDVEKADSKLTEFEMTKQAKPSSKWGRKTDK